MEEDFNQFIKCLKVASKNMADASYFQIDNTGSEELIYRERVYCYELYHQLRCVLGEYRPYKLQGEMDKSSHTEFAKPHKPDFIFHVPRNMQQNLVVVEVKKSDAVNNNLDDFKKDINKLK
ncbi:MAG: hypothetical protein ABFC12_04380 [Methanobacterium sp.]